MKKIMFNDKFGLTQAVLEGRKTQTRRLLHCPKTFGGKYVSGFRLCTNKQGVQFTYLVDEDECEIDGSVNVLSAYKIGEEVAIAQSYQDCGYVENDYITRLGGRQTLEHTAGWRNKMFVKAKLMPHHIKITNVRMQRLQDISEEDCFAEGICAEQLSVQTKEYYQVIKKALKKTSDMIYGYIDNEHNFHRLSFISPKVAFAELIDKVGKKGTWESNPWVFVYEFELVD